MSFINSIQCTILLYDPIFTTRFHLQLESVRSSAEEYKSLYTNSQSRRAAAEQQLRVFVGLKALIEENKVTAVSI